MIRYWDFINPRLFVNNYQLKRLTEFLHKVVEVELTSTIRNSVDILIRLWSRIINKYVIRERK